MASQPRRASGVKQQRLVQALLATGRGAEERARWLIGFANQDLSRPTDEVVERLRGELYVWSLGDPQRIDVERARRESLTASPLFEPFSVPTDHVLEVIEKCFQEPLCKYLRAFIRDGRVTIHDAAGVPFLKRHEDGTVSRRLLGSVVVAFFGGVADVLAELGPRLRICEAPGCQNFLVAVRRQAYCSTSCSQRVRTARFNAKHPVRIAERRRDAYVERRRNTLGKRVKVALRRPKGTYREDRRGGSSVPKGDSTST